MKGYLVKYSTGSYDDYCTHDVKVFLNRKEAERYYMKFNQLIVKASEFYESEYVKIPENEEEYQARADYWETMWDKYSFWRDFQEVFIEEIEIVESVKKKDNSRWD